MGLSLAWDGYTERAIAVGVTVEFFVTYTLGHHSFQVRVVVAHSDKMRNKSYLSMLDMRIEVASRLVKMKIKLLKHKHMVSHC